MSIDNLLPDDYKKETWTVEQINTLDIEDDATFLKALWQLKQLNYKTNKPESKKLGLAILVYISEGDGITDKKTFFYSQLKDPETRDELLQEDFITDLLSHQGYLLYCQDNYDIEQGEYLNEEPTYIYPPWEDYLDNYVQYDFVDEIVKTSGFQKIFKQEMEDYQLRQIAKGAKAVPNAVSNGKGPFF